MGSENRNNTQLFPFELWQPIADRLAGERVGLVPNIYGNVGDRLITWGTLEVFQHFEIAHRTVNVNELRPGYWPADVTVLAEPGGGSLGTRAGLGSPHRRQVLAQMAGPKVILPQTTSDAGEDLSAFDTVFVRESTSRDLLRRLPDVRLAPDMALCLQFQAAHPVEEEGVFFRSDIERLGAGGQGDPVEMCSTTQQYIELAGRYKRITTNRLHFALAAMLQGVDVALCPGSYHKNLSVYRTWLQDTPNISFCSQGDDDNSCPHDTSTTH